MSKGRAASLPGVNGLPLADASNVPPTLVYLKEVKTPFTRQAACVPYVMRPSCSALKAINTLIHVVRQKNEKQLTLACRQETNPKVDVFPSYEP
jgi:hypothetical protein